MCLKSETMEKTESNHYKRKSKIQVLLDHSELQKLRTDADSCVEVKTCAHHITLHPFHLSNVANSIKEILNKGIAKYSAEFGGILLGYENIKVFGYKAPMYDDMCFMHQTIEADFYIFTPTIGCTLNGVINKKSEDHIGCLVHKLFNISLPKPRNQSQDWLGFKAQIGQEVQFRVNFMQLDARLPYIRGELLAIVSEDSGISTSDETGHPKKNKIKKFTDEDEADAPVQTESESVKKRKLKKKKMVGNSEAEVLQEQDTSMKKKKSKKEKKSKLKTSIEEVTQQNNQIPEEIIDSITLIEDLKGKYLEQLSILKEIANNDNSDNVTVQKKKKKKDKVKDHNQNSVNERETNESEAKKDKKRKKNKVKIKTKERDLLDETLPDLNLDKLFESGSLSMQKGTDMETSFSQDIVLPPDSDMDEVLRDIPKTKAKKAKKTHKTPSPTKKRKLDDDTFEDSSFVSKKKKKT